MNAAIVERDRVVNVIVVDDMKFSLPDTEIVFDQSLSIGMERRGGQWGNPDTQEFINDEWRDKEPPREPTEEEIFEAEVDQKEREILRRMAIEELEAEKERG